MKKQIRQIIEAILFFLCGNLIRLSFSGQLNSIDNIVLLITAILIVAHIWTAKDE